MNYRLTRHEDGLINTGTYSVTVGEKTFERPTVGFGLRVGTFDYWWTTTRVQKLIEDTEKKVVFKTLNSTYTWEKLTK